MGFDRSNLVEAANRAFKIRTPQVHVPSPEFALSDNFIGVEQEVEGVKGRSWKDPDGNYCGPAGWSPEIDGSLRDGVEFVFIGPKLGEEITKSLVAFEEWSTKHKPKSSFRTSTHVHVDFSQERDTLFLIHDFLIGYYLLEEAFFAFGDPARRYTGYCVAFADADEELSNILRASTRGDMYMAIRSMNRYHACNPTAISTHGTIEFRHLPLTISSKRLHQWINLILRLKRFMLVNTSTGRSALDAIGAMGTTAFALDVFGELAEELMPTIDLNEIGRRLCYLRTVYGQARPNSHGMDPDRVQKNPIYKKLIGKIPAKLRKPPKAIAPKAEGLKVRWNPPLAPPIARPEVAPDEEDEPDWAAAGEMFQLNRPVPVRRDNRIGTNWLRPVAIYVAARDEAGINIYTSDEAIGPYAYMGGAAIPPAMHPMVTVDQVQRPPMYRRRVGNMAIALGALEAALVSVREFPRNIEEYCHLTRMDHGQALAVGDDGLSYWQAYINRVFGHQQAVVVPLNPMRD